MSKQTAGPKHCRVCGDACHWPGRGRGGPRSGKGLCKMHFNQARKVVSRGWFNHHMWDTDTEADEVWMREQTIEDIVTVVPEPVEPSPPPTCPAIAWGEPCGDKAIGRDHPWCALHYSRVKAIGQTMVTKPGWARYRESDGLFEDEDPRTAIIRPEYIECYECKGNLMDHEWGQCVPSRATRTGTKPSITFPGRKKRWNS